MSLQHTQIQYTQLKIKHITWPIDWPKPEDANKPRLIDAKLDTIPTQHDYQPDHELCQDEKREGE